MVYQEWSAAVSPGVYHTAGGFTCLQLPRSISLCKSLVNTILQRSKLAQRLRTSLRSHDISSRDRIAE